MEPLKEMFNTPFYKKLAAEFKKAESNFNEKQFVNTVTKNLSDLELNQRLRNTSVVLKQFLPSEYRKSIELMKRVIPNMHGGYANLIFPDFTGLYGKHDFDFSLEALKYFTQFGSSEFAIREYLKHDFDKTIKVMFNWAKDKNHHVRRLASEGSRPRLPWSFKLDRVIENPKLTLPILEQLKNDNELYVRKSVANHLNDISKEHPNLIIDVVKKWKRKSAHTDWILKHGSRTLLKKGNKHILAHFGIKENKAIKVTGFQIKEKQIKTGDYVNFSFALSNSSLKAVSLRIEYAVYFLAANGSHSKKVFKISERELPAKSDLKMTKAHSFKKISTRKYNKGLHKLALIVNGKEFATQSFNLI